MGRDECWPDEGESLLSYCYEFAIRSEADVVEIVMEER